MSKFALVKNDVVENTIVAEGEWAQEYAADNGFELINLDDISDPIGIGYTRVNGVFTAPEPVVVEEPPTS